MLKKGDWHESVWELVVNYGHDRSGRPGEKRDHELERGQIWWMMKSQYTETLTPVLLMKHL